MEHSRLALTGRADLHLAALLVAPVGLMLITGPGVTKSLFYVAALTSAVSWMTRRDKLPPLHAPTVTLAVLTIVWLTLSHIWSGRFASLELIKLGATGASLVVFILLGARTAGRIQTLHLALTVAGLGAGLLAVAAYALETGPRDHFGRLLGYGQLENPVLAGGTFGFLTLIAALRMREGLWWVAATLCFATLTVATGSRSPLLGLGVTALIGLPGRWRALPAVGVISVALLPLLADIPDSALAERDFTRLSIWLEVAADASPTEWLVGRGLGAPFEVVLEGIPYGHAHSAFAATFVHGGLTGLLGLGILTGLLVTRALTAPAVIGLPFVYGVVVILLDGSRLVGDINLVWLVFWLPAGALLVQTGAAGAVGYNPG